MIHRILGLGAAMLFAALVTASAQTPMSSDAAEPAKIAAGQAGADPALIDQGKATYAAKCSHCHGFGMVNAGTIAPDLRKFPQDEARFVTTVKLGKNNKMPPWGDLLNDDQIFELWAYVSSQRKP